jgi:hypothetical protein
MIRNLMALPCMLALVLACGQGRTDGQDTGAAAGGGAESGALPADTGVAGGGIEDTTAAPSIDAADTAAPTGDTASGNESGSADSANQDQSGVTNSETGESELGEDVTKTTPDQGEPVTSKGDTVGTSGEGATSDTTY